MEDKKTLWNSKQKTLKEIIMKPDRFEEAIKLCLEQHSMMHSSEMSNLNTVTFEDEVWDGLDEDTFRTSVNKKGRTVAYGMWHSARIEDMTMNILAADSVQVIDEDNWIKKLNSEIYDTGNELTPPEILKFSSTINMKELYNYRIAVGKRTQEIITNLKCGDMKKKVKPEGLKKILEIGAVADVESANWLIDFWGKKNIAGLLLMPATRHLLVHINESIDARKIKK